MTRVYVFDCRGEPLPEGAAALLPSWRRERYDRLRHPDARRQSLCAGLLYAFAMAQTGVPPEAAVDILPAGKPVLAGREGVFFSLSHAGGRAMCAVGPAAVGADVERPRDVKLSIARRFHPAERAWLEALPEAERREAFFRLWTRKEAWVKAVSGERMLSLDEADVFSPLPGLWFRDYALPDGCFAAVCAGEPDIGEPEDVSREELLALPGR